MALQKEEYLEPAASVIKMLGGVVKVSKIVNRHPSRICDWRISRERGGTGGEIPTAALPKLRKAAKEIGKSATLSAHLAEANNETIN